MESNMEIVWIEEDRHFAVVDSNGQIIIRCIDERQAHEAIERIQRNIYNESSEE